MVNKVILALVIAASFGIVPNANAALLDCVADDVTLSALIASDGCQVGDKLFSDFDLSSASPTPTASQITVQGITVDGNFGLTFQGGFFAAAGDTLDFLISYVVEVLDPSQLLTDIHLAFNGVATGDGFASVDETVFKGATIIGQASVDTTDPPESLSSTVFLTEPVDTARVVKDIFLTGGEDGTARISFVDQVTSQTAIPEPATMTLLGTGLLGVARYARRRRQAA